MRRSRIFYPGLTEGKKCGHDFFLVLNFYSYRGGPMVLLQRKLYFSKDPVGVQHFAGVVQLFPGGEGVKC